VAEQPVIRLDRLAMIDSLQVLLRLSVARLAVFPTDTVYGLGGTLRPEVGAAIEAVKGREPGKPLQVIFPTRELLLESVEFTRAMTDVLLRLLPGPLTVVVPYPEGFSYPPPAEATWTRKGRFGLGSRSETIPTLGLRVPRWPQAAAIMATLSVPLLASSANRAGEPAPSALDEVEPGLRAACDLLLDGGPAAGVASTVVDFSGYDRGYGYRILRAGAVTREQIDEMLIRKREDLPRP
jgi:L-threonylcarbamoyladenylate synthase